MSDRAKLQLHLLSSLAIFVLVVEKGSFSAAARELNQTPSSVSRAISAFEDRTQTQLFIRSKKALRLTAMGGQIYELGREMVFSAQRVFELCRSKINEQNQMISIVGPRAYMKYVVGPIVQRYFQLRPNVSFQILADDGKFIPAEHPYDLIFQIGTVEPKGFGAIRLGTVEYVLCASKDYIQREAPIISPEHLSDHRIISFPGITTGEPFSFVNGPEKYISDLSISLSINHFDAIADAAKNGSGIAVLPNFIANELISSEEVEVVLPDYSIEMSKNIGVYLLNSFSSIVPSHIEGFLEFLTLSLRV